MITKIDITKFGLYNGFMWDKVIGKDNHFIALMQTSQFHFVIKII